MRNDEQQRPSMRENIRNQSNLIYLLAKGLGACVTPFIRCNFGANALGAPGLIAFAIIVIYAGAQNAPEMILYLVAWFLMVAFRTSQARRMERRGRGEHSLYGGSPWLVTRFLFVRDKVKAKGIEFFLCVFGGALLCPLSEPFGKFVMLSGVGLCIVHLMDLRACETRARRMRDSMIEMQQMIEDVRRYR